MSNLCRLGWHKYSNWYTDIEPATKSKKPYVVQSRICSRCQLVDIREGEIVNAPPVKPQVKETSK